MFQSIIDFLADFGIWGLMIHSFIDAIIFPIPAFFLQVSLSLIDPSQALWFATAGYIACLLGTPIGYFLGKALSTTVLSKILKKKWLDSATAMFQKNGEMAILIGSFTPIPFKIFTILSGSMNFSLWKLIAYASIGRAVKFYVIGILFYLYGKTAEGMIHNVSLYIFIICVPIVLVFLILKKKHSQSKKTHDRAQ